MCNLDLKWLNQFEIFIKLYKLIENTLAADKIVEYSLFAKVGAIRWYELAFDASWDLITDYLKYSGFDIKYELPQSIIKIAFDNGILNSSQEWIDMLNLRKSPPYKDDIGLIPDHFNNICNIGLKQFEYLNDFFLNEKKKSICYINIENCDLSEFYDKDIADKLALNKNIYSAWIYWSRDKVNNEYNPDIGIVIEGNISNLDLAEIYSLRDKLPIYCNFNVVNELKLRKERFLLATIKFGKVFYTK